MPRPKTKEELLKLSQSNFEKIWKYLNTLTEEEKLKEFSSDSLNRNIRDVLAHLHHWHILFLGWYEKGEKGEKPEMPAKGYTWKTLPLLNKKIWEKYSNSDLNDISQRLKKSFEDVQKIINTHSEESLFEKKKYKWTGSTSLGAYLISNTSSHYAWALKLIKKSLK